MAEIITKESPFSPGRPVQPEYFVARTKELDRLERALKQTASGRNENIFITGQRGIGKSSLAGLIRHHAEKEHGFIGAHCYLGGIRTLEEMIGTIFERLFLECTDKRVFDKLKNIFDKYISEVKLFGVGIEFTKNTSKLRGLLDNFLPAMRNIYGEVKANDKNGLVLILDDLNGISDVPQFSQFLKSFVDTLATSGKPLPLLLILVGLPERRNDMLKHQPSVARIFDIVELSLMSEDESQDFFQEMFKKQTITIAEKALSLMVKLSGGYPMLLHEVGDAVFWQDTDNHISDSDARQGIMEAARIVGRKYIDTKISKVLRSETYSSILWQMGKKLPVGVTFRRQELLKAVGEKEKKNLDNFLNRIKKLGLVDDAEVRGEYTFVNPLYHLYLWFEAKNRAR